MANTSAPYGKSRPHVVIVPTPGSGHSIPCVQYAKLLCKSGITTTFVSTDSHIAKMIQENHGTADSTYDGPDLRFVSLQDGIKRAADPNALEEKKVEEATLAKLLEALLVNMMETTTASCKINQGSVPPGGKPCCILSDMFVLGWTSKVAEKLDIESHVLLTSGAAFLSFAFQLRRLVDEGLLSPSNQSTPICIPGLPPLSPLDVPRPLHAENDDPLFIYCLRHFLPLTQVSVLLINTFHELEGRVFDALQTQVIGTPSVKARSVLPIGPLLLTEGQAFQSHKKCDLDIVQGQETRSDPCLLWLNTQVHSSVVYISFGSEPGALTGPQILELAQGLEASEQPFLWILRPPNAAPPSASELPPSVSELLPPGFEERVKDHGLIYSGWAPQQQILSHPAVGGFLTHCGWNSTLESICAGVPLLTWPLAAEQHMNARFLVDTAKLGMEMQRGESGLYEKAEIERAVRVLMREDEGLVIRSRMKAMGDAAWTAFADGGSSNRNLNAYVNELKSNIPSNISSQAE